MLDDERLVGAKPTASQAVKDSSTAPIGGLSPYDPAVEGDRS